MTSELYELLQKATQADVDECDAELKRLRDERDRITLQLGKVEELRRVFDIAVNGKSKRAYTPKKAKEANKANLSASAPERGKLPNPTDTNTRRRLVAEYLIKHGATRRAVLADALDIPYGSMGGLMADSAFATVKDGYIITPDGMKRYFPKS